MKPEYPQKTTDLSQVTDKLDHIMFIEYTSPEPGLVMIGTDCMGCYKSNNYTINDHDGPQSDIIEIHECNRFLGK